ncbi:MAG: sugar ABC transporter substrate-binding protein [Methylococcaceae bacterium]|jgi:multiple sugar transport system substrate-binding protein
MRAFLCLLLSVLLSACEREPTVTAVTFWAMGREGDLVQSLVPAFERQNPDIQINVQQIPWSAAHEKLLTAFAGDALPDVVQLGNTWVPEFVALGALDPLDGKLDAAVQVEDFFAGILDTSRLEGRLYGIPWYVDTRLIFYNKDRLAEVGYHQPPKTRREWLDLMARLKALPGAEHYPLLLPMNEWQLPVILALQTGAELLSDGGRHGHFQGQGFHDAFTFYLDLFRQGYAPALAEAQIANLYREFSRGYFALYITGPWNIGEFERRLPPEMADHWDTAVLPSPHDQDSRPGLSLAGGASLGLVRSSQHKAAALRWIEYLAQPAQQATFYRLTGDLPARQSAWTLPELVTAPHVAAFRQQLAHVAATPKIPEWERIAAKLSHYAEKAVRGEMSEAQALAALDADVERILEKRRWLLDRAALPRAVRP